MSKSIRKGTLKEKVANLRLKGLTNQQVSVRLECKPEIAKVLWWQYNNAQKHNNYNKEYYKKNKKKIQNYNKQWYKKNPDLITEYQWRNKCNKAGVDWRVGA